MWSHAGPNSTSRLRPAQLAIDSQPGSPGQRSRTQSPSAALREVKERLQQFRSGNDSHTQRDPFPRNGARMQSSGHQDREWSSSSSEAAEKQRKFQRGASTYTQHQWSGSRYESRGSRRNDSPRPWRQHPSKASDQRETLSRNCSPLKSVGGRHEGQGLGIADIDARLQTLQEFLRAAKKA